MGLIIYSSPYIPAELIAAYGMTPTRILPLSANLSDPVDVTAGVCHYMRDFVNTACAVPEVNAIILTTVCDQMRRAKDYIEPRTTLPVFLMNVPSTWQTPEVIRLYISELRRLGRFLERMGGKTPSADVLWYSMESYDRKREQLRGLRGSLPALDYSRAIAEFNRTGEIADSISTMGLGKGGIPLAFLGGPLTLRDFDLFEIVRRAGGEIVLDGTESGERTMPAPFNRRHSPGDDPFEELAACYFGSIPDVFQRPNSELYKWLACEVDSRGIRGVIMIRHVWCDKWHAEVDRLKEWLKIPLMDIDLDGEAATARNTGRIQAFIEALS